MGHLLSHGLVFFKAVPNLASYKTVSCQNSLILKGAVDKVTQFHHIYLYYVPNFLGKMVRENEIITGIKINGKEFRLSQYADDTQLFLVAQNNHLMRHLMYLKYFT